MCGIAYEQSYFHVVGSLTAPASGKGRVDQRCSPIVTYMLTYAAEVDFLFLDLFDLSKVSVSAGASWLQLLRMAQHDFVRHPGTVYTVRCKS